VRLHPGAWRHAQFTVGELYATLSTRGRSRSNLSKLGKVPSATHADSANSAITATTALTAGSATTAAAANSLNGVQIVACHSTPNPADSQDSETVVCPAGMSVIGGGVQASGGVEEAINEEIIFSTSGGTNNALTIYVNSISGAGTPPVFAAVSDDFHVYAVCVRGSVGGQAF
jgi:hypothetical protein